MTRATFALASKYKRRLTRHIGNTNPDRYRYAAHTGLNMDPIEVCDGIVTRDTVSLVSVMGNITTRDCFLWTVGKVPFINVGTLRAPRLKVQ